MAWREELADLFDQAGLGDCAARESDGAESSGTAVAGLPAGQPAVDWRLRVGSWFHERGVILLPIGAAVALVGLTFSRMSAGTDVRLAVILAAAIGAGHVLMRSRSGRLRAEREATRAQDELDLRAQVADCEARRHRLAGFSRLAAQIAHEVRNPLSSIVLNTELLEEEMGACVHAGPEMKALAASIKAEAERLHTLTDEYLTFARLPALERSAVPINSLVGELAQFVRNDARRQGVSVITVLDDRRPVAMVDSRQVRQVVLNLVRNAVEAMPRGGTVTLRTGLADERALIEVADTGPGVPGDLAQAIFDPFFSTKPRGTGLGLSVAQRVVHEHGGTIEVQNDNGAHFRVLLPLAGAV